MAQRYTDETSRLLAVSGKTNVAIYQSDYFLVAACSSCKGDIFWSNNLDSWYCSNRDPGRPGDCSEVMKSVPRAASNSRFSMGMSFTVLQIRGWTSQWLGEVVGNVDVKVLFPGVCL